MKESVFSGIPLVKSSNIHAKPLNQRSVILFHSAIKSEKTKAGYDQILKKFKEHFIIKDFDSLVAIEPKKIQEMIEDYVLYQRSRNKSRSFVYMILSSLKLFFSMNDITLNWVKVSKMIPEKTKSINDKPEQIKTILEHTGNIKFKAMINFMSASGVRIGSFEEMRIKDIEKFKDGSKLVKVYAESYEEYYTFIHAEAVKALEEYFEYRRKKGEKLTPESWVFIKNTNPALPITSHTAGSSLNRFITMALDRKKTGLRFDNMTSHAFRKRFATVLKSNKEINLSISEKLMGHSTTVQLDNSYFKPQLEQLYEEYEKAIPELVIDQTMKLKLELEKKDNQLSSLEVKDRRIEVLENALSRIENNMHELNSRLS